MRTQFIAAVIGITMAPTLAHADIDTILSDAAQICADQASGTFSSDGAVRTLDLTGDGTDDTLVDEGQFRCSSAASLYAAPDGSRIHIIANGTESSYVVTGWDTARWNDSLIVLLALPGTDCAAPGTLSCYEALTWGETGFLSVRARQN